MKHNTMFKGVSRGNEGWGQSCNPQTLFDKYF
jgi:hypothetical protein